MDGAIVHCRATGENLETGQHSALDKALRSQISAKSHC